MHALCKIIAVNHTAFAKADYVPKQLYLQRISKEEEAL